MGHLLPAALALLDRTFRSKPLLFVVLAWMAGIGLADRWAVAPAGAGAAGLILGLTALAARQRWRTLILLLAGVAALATAAARLALAPPQGDVAGWIGRQVAIVGVVEDTPSTRCDDWRCFVRCRSVIVGGRAQAARGGLYLTTLQILSCLEPGDEIVAYGVPDAPSPPRNPGGFSQACWLARRGVFATLAARRGSVVRLGPGAWNWRRWIGRLRQRIAAANMRAVGDRPAAALVNSILFGDLDTEDPRDWGGVEEQFRRAGVSHVLVVSGAQVALLFGLLVGWRRWALRWAGRFGRHWRLVRGLGGYSIRQALGGGLLLLALYVPLVGLQPSILRPALVVTIYFLGRCLDREVDAENSLAAAALLLLVLNPLTLYDLSFQLSFAAVWGIIRWFPLMAKWLAPAWTNPGTEAVSPAADRGFASHAKRIAGTVLQCLAGILAMTLAAQFAIVPLVARQFQTVSPIAPLSNIPIEALAALLLPIGLLSSALNVLAPAAAGAPLHWINELAAFLARLIGESAAVFARPGWATVPVAPPGWAELALVAGLLLAATTPGLSRSPRRVFVLLGVAMGVFAISLWRPAAPVRVPTFTFIDVGQGDGCLIQLPSGANILVDGGGSPRAPCARRDCADAPVGQLAGSIRTDCTDVGRDILARLLRYERVRRIDLMVLSHPHDDHLWGLDALLDSREHFDVRAVLDAGRPISTPAWREWLALLRRRHLTPIPARRGTELTLGPARLSVLSPPEPLLRHTRSDENNNSIVLRVEVGGARVLLTGDAEAEAEAAMAGEDVQAAVLKVGHHGSAYSTSDAWLARVRPRIAVISCGRHNAFGHPSPATLERLRRHGVRVFRTDQDGAITLELWPSGWTATPLVRPQSVPSNHLAR